MNWATIPILTLLALAAAAPAAAGPNPAEAVVSVVSLDSQKQPWRQGLGIVVGKDGRVLTSGAILGQCQEGVIKTASGGMYVFHKVLQRDLFQDLVLVQMEGEDLPAATISVAARSQTLGPVQVVVQHDGAPKVRQASLAKTLPFSPRLVLLKIEPGDLGRELGTPVLNGKGELVGMRHAFAGSPGKADSCQFYLARDRSHLPREFTLPNAPPVMAAPQAMNSADFWEGVAASLRQDWQKARDRFTAALSGPEKLPEAYFGRGVAYFQLQEYDRAVPDFQEATRRLPRYALASFYLGQVWERQGKGEPAAEAYRQAVAADPDLSEAWFRLGVLLYQRGSLGEAQHCLEKAGDRLPQAAQRWWYLGGIAQAQNRWQDALEALKQAIKADPNFFPAYLEGGKLLVRDLGRPKEAVPLLKEAVRLDPRHVIARYYLALAYLMSWNPAGVWEQYFILQDLAPDLAASLAVAMEKQ
jgi:tetratricopeptide (TPR) repeat protein